jgi:endonuclease/exonuclease/phosphatase family metal-dependent hydrolase
MRIISWNCAVASQENIDLLMGLNPDVAVVPECSRANIDGLKARGHSAFWVGEQDSKGLGVVAGKEWQLVPRPDNMADLKTVIAFDVHGPLDFTLIAVWTHSTTSYKGYAQELHAIAAHPEWFKGGPVVLAGDLNSNSRWDAECKPNDHSSFVELLRALGLESSYHFLKNEQQGAETKYTHHHRWKENKGFHIDYVFVPVAWLKQISGVEIGTYAQWGRASDHCPVTVDLRESD